MGISTIKPDNKPHMGRNLQRVREIVGMKQDVMGAMTKSQYKQQTVSKWEQEETIPDDILDEFAEVLGVTSDFIKNFNEEKAVYNIQSHFTLSDHSIMSSQHSSPVITYEAANKIAELFEKFIASDKERLDLITNLNKAVLELANEVKRMKEGK